MSFMEKAGILLLRGNIYYPAKIFITTRDTKPLKQLRRMAFKNTDRSEAVVVAEVFYRFSSFIP